MKPDPSTYNPSPEYFRELVEKTGLSQVACAALLDLGPSTFRRYLMPEGTPSRLVPDYRTQFALEALAAAEDCAVTAADLDC